MGDWVAFWNSQHSIYVNARHRDVHYRTIAHDLELYLPAVATVLDYGCGDALHADLIATPGRELTLCEAASSVRAELTQRFGSHARIRVLSPEELAALPAGSFDVIVMHSVAQYLGPAEMETLLAEFQRLLRVKGFLILGDVVSPHVYAAADAMVLLRFAAANGFLGAAIVGLTRTLLSEYWRLRSRIGLTRYSEAAMIEKLAGLGYSANRVKANIGHNPYRMTFLARRREARNSEPDRSSSAVNVSAVR
jgi:SAM-dependent methyltransferase